MKRPFFLILAVLAVLAIVAGGYFLRGMFTGSSGPVGGDPIVSNSGSLPPPPDLSKSPLGGSGGNLPNGSGPAATKFGVVTENKVADFFIDSQNAILVVEPSGKVSKVKDGVSSALSGAPIGGLARASFSFDGAHAFVTFGEQHSQQTSIFNVRTATWQPLPQTIQNPTWAPNSQKLAFFSLGADTSNISVIDFALRSPLPQSILRIHAKDLVLDWPRPDYLIMSEKKSSLVQGALYALHAKNGTMNFLGGDQGGVHAIWSPDADRGLMFVGGPTTRGNFLMLVDYAGITKPLSLFTLPSKCVFGSETSTATTPTSKPGSREFLVCAVPRSLQGIGQGRLLDLYEQRAFYTTDDFYTIDISTGDVSAIWNDAAYEVDATNLKIFGDRVFFVNRYDERLYTIALK